MSSERAPESLPPVEHLPTREGYDRWSELYDFEFNPLVRLEERCAPALIGDVAGLRVLDLGCGTGRHALRLAAAGAAVTAVDASRGMLDQARRKPGADRVRFIEHDVTGSLPLPDHAFDLVVCALVLDHVADLPPFFSECRRVARPGAKLLYSVMHPAMMLLGVQARFTDPASGTRVQVASARNQIANYVMAALGAGLQIDHMSEHIVDESLAAQNERAAKYLGWPLLLLLRLTAP